MRTLSIEELSTISGSADSAPPFGGYDDGPAAAPTPAPKPTTPAAKKS